MANSPSVTSPRDLSPEAQILASVDWIVPAYIQIGMVRRLARKVDAAATAAEKVAVLEQTIGSLYGPRDLAVMLLERYAKIPFIKDFKDPIAEAIEAAQLGLYHSAVGTLVPTIEGIVDRLAEARHTAAGIKRRKPKEYEWLYNEFKDIASRERNAERMVMLRSFEDFLKRTFYKSGRSGGWGKLNRHGIVHGTHTDYGTVANFCRLISFVDILCFFVTLRERKGAVLPPDPTPDSERLTAFYSELNATRSALRKRHRV